ncbi:MAG: hypothetical protein IH984_10930 [Planctomycetes bacterium]|nr:hypothetical protein [Planctomycetota bacterium]
MAELSLIQSPIAVGAKGAAGMFSMSERNWRRLNSSGLIPSPIRINGAVRWLVCDLNLWAKRDCPTRAVFEQQRLQEPETKAL